MPSRMARILNRRPDAPPPQESSNGSTGEATVVVPALSDGQIAPPAEVAESAPAPDQPTTVAPAVETGTPPATEGTALATEVAPPAAVATQTSTTAATELAADPARDVPARANFRNRSRLRRRLRYLRRVREIAFRDLGGLVFDLDRFGRDRPDLVEMKLQGLRSIDAELRALEIALDDVRDFEELHEPGISACVHCGALHGSEARFCPSCGTAVDASMVTGAELASAAPAPLPEAPAAEAPAEDATVAEAPPAESAAEPEQSPPA